MASSPRQPPPEQPKTSQPASPVPAPSESPPMPNEDEATTPPPERDCQL